MKKLVKHGNSFALVIDKPLMQVLNITNKTNLEITIQDNSLIITPVNATKKKKSKTREQEIDEIAKRILERYDPVFKKLAKS